MSSPYFRHIDHRSSRPGPIAVVGMGCRFAGAPDPEQLWELLVQGMDMTSAVPIDRFDVASLYSPIPKPGKVVSRRAGFIDGVGLFDTEFFDIPADEAAEMDPQQRLLLMTAWEALEDAGFPTSAIAGTRAGVYIGCMHLDYRTLQLREELCAISPHAVKNYYHMLAGRVSYAFDLRGPSIAIDTACSSSLVAVHLACQSLRAGEIPWALVGGVNLKLVPDVDVMLSQLGVLAPDGRSKFGDATADGFALSDGVGVVVLKPLHRAIADGDQVRAIIRGSAVCNDGRGGGDLLRPSLEGFESMLRLACADADVAPCDIDFVEAHGTGTRLIDPVELTALGAVLSPGRSPRQPCLVGSLKSNVGYAAGAAGVGGLIKAVLSLEHSAVPASLHFATPNPAIAWDALALEVPTTLRKLPPRGRPLLAGVTAQGASGVNTHVVLEEATPRGNGDRQPNDRLQEHVLALSAKTETALDCLIRRYIDYLSPNGSGHGFALSDICHSAALRRDHYQHRLAVIGRSHEQMTRCLRGALAVRTRQGPEGTAEPDFAESEQDPASTMAALMYEREGVVPQSSVQGTDAAFVPLPHYPWQTEHYWHASPGRDRSGPTDPAPAATV